MNLSFHIKYFLCKENILYIFMFSANIASRCMESNLSISEKLLLLSIHPEKGGYLLSTHGTLNLILLGASFLDMELNGQVKLDGKLVILQSGKPKDEANAYLYEKISAASRPRRIGYWLSAMSVSKRKLRNHLLNSLVAKREIRMVEKSFLFFRWRVPYLQTGSSLQKLVVRIRLKISGPIDLTKDIYLLSMLEPAWLLKRIFPDRTQWRNARQRIKQLKAGVIPDSVRQAVQTASSVAASVAIHAAIASSARH